MSDGFDAQQRINKWVEMLHTIYGPSQNYSKSTFEILSHLNEVSGLLGKYLFRKNDIEAARKFLPKLFSWGIALLKAVRAEETDLERIILQKFPTVCAYCAEKPCLCSKGVKPTPNPEKMRQLYQYHSPSQKRSVGEFQLMFREVYGSTWDGNLDLVYRRLIEELAELAEAVRFYHLYPINFENELADFFAWWFALSILVNKSADGSKHIEQLLWEAYPAQCIDCNSMPCFCPPQPVRELMSKPAPGQFDKTDALTSLRNQAAYKSDIKEIASGKLAMAFPIACIRIDVDDFKSVNDKFGHAAGDEALKHIAALMRKKARIRDRLYRAGGDEFAMILVDCSEEEAFGLMKRFAVGLKETPARWVSADGKAVEFPVSTSIGIAECPNHSGIEAAFDAADAASYASKKAGKKTITRATTVAVEPT